MSYRKQELLTLPEHLSSPWFFHGVRVAHLKKEIVLSTYVSLHSEFPSCDVRNDFNIKRMFGSSFPPVVICVCLRIVVFHKYCVVFMICFSSSCVPYVASVS
jgi:hypothetical protein